MSDLIEIREPHGQAIAQPAHLPVIPGGWAEQSFQIDERSIRLTLPALPDAFLDDPEVQAAHDATEYMPYWAYLWPSAIHMARLVHRASWTTNGDVLELGAGIGLVGLAALARGNRVTFSDYEPQAVQLALHNAEINGLSARAQSLVLDWRQPTAQIYPVIVGCEVIYEDRNHEPILRLLQSMLAPDGIAWFGDGGRWRAERFSKLLPEFGFQYRLFDEAGEPIPSPRAGRFQLFEVRRA